MYSVMIAIAYTVATIASWTEKKFNLWCELGWLLNRQSHIIFYLIVGMFGRFNVRRIAEVKVVGKKVGRMDRFCLHTYQLYANIWLV